MTRLTVCYAMSTFNETQEECYRKSEYIRKKNPREFHSLFSMLSAITFHLHRSKKFVVW